jgi:ABC-2 type transport system permease protein
VKSEVKEAPFAVYDADRSADSRRLVDEVVATGQVAPARQVASYAAVEGLFRRGAAAAALVIPPGFAEAIARGERTPVQLLLNGADPLVALRFSTIAADVARRFGDGAAAARAAFRPREARGAAFVLRPSYRFNPRLEDIWFFVPTIPAIFFTQFFFGLACFSIAGERERGTYEALLALPLEPFEILVGKAVPFFVVGFAVGAGYYAFAEAALGVTIRGSALALAAATFLFFVDAYLIAALFSAIARNVHQAVYLTVFSVLPSTVISGFLVPTSTMPHAIEVAAQALPTTHYVTLLRAIVVRGTPLAELGRPLIALGVIGAVALALVLAFFPRRVD